MCSRSRGAASRQASSAAARIVARGDRAEVQVRRKARGPGAVGPVAVVGVVRGGRGEETSEQPPGSGLAAGRRERVRSSVAPRGDFRKRHARKLRGRERGGRGPGRSLLGGHPLLGERRVDGVGIASVGRDLVRRNEQLVVEEPEFPARVLDRGGRFTIAPLRVRADLGIGVDGLGARLREQCRQRPRGGSRAHDQAAARARQGAGELLEALVQEAESRRPDVRIAGVVVVEDEDRHDPLGVARRVRERGVVRDAQVASEPVDDRQPASFTMFQLRNPANATQAA